LYRLQSEKIVATHYQHVDGTSFAAPITASLVAQMLEANPQLSPAMVKRILISSASRISNQPAIRQGYGVLNAGLATAQASRENHWLENGDLRGPMVEGNQLVFMYHDHSARQVALVGDFNHWDPSAAPMLHEVNGTWMARIELPYPGRHAYKFLIDGEQWVEDPSHGIKEPDGHGGLNSVIDIV
jgi:serine protease AprX